MSVRRDSAAEPATLRPLAKPEIDRLLEAAVASVTTPTPTSSGSASRERVKPRWITSAEFVRRMIPYIVYN